MRPALAIDLGGSKILAALVAGKTVLARAQGTTDAGAAPDIWLCDMIRLAAPWSGRYDAAGLTVTGLVQDGRWSALNPAVLPIPPGFPLAARMRAALGREVTLANDAQAAAWGEHLHGAGKGADMVFLTISTGIGGGVVLGGRLLRGRSGLAGHFGQFVPVEGDGPRLEDAASGRWIGWAGQAADARAVFAAAAQGEARPDAVIATSAARVARLCRNLQMAFDPALIVIGGGVGLAPGYLARVEQALGSLPALLRPRIVAAALGADAGAIGIAALALERTTETITT